VAPLALGSDSLSAAATRGAGRVGRRSQEGEQAPVAESGLARSDPATLHNPTPGESNGTAQAKHTVGPSASASGSHPSGPNPRCSRRHQPSACVNRPDIAPTSRLNRSIAAR